MGFHVANDTKGRNWYSIKFNDREIFIFSVHQRYWLIPWKMFIFPRPIAWIDILKSHVIGQCIRNDFCESRIFDMIDRLSSWLIWIQKFLLPVKWNKF